MSPLPRLAANLPNEHIAGAEIDNPFRERYQSQDERVLTEDLPSASAYDEACDDESAQGRDGASDQLGRRVNDGAAARGLDTIKHSHRAPHATEGSGWIESARRAPNTPAACC